MYVHSFTMWFKTSNPHQPHFQAFNCKFIDPGDASTFNTYTRTCTHGKNKTKVMTKGKITLK